MVESQTSRRGELLPAQDPDACAEAQHCLRGCALSEYRRVLGRGTATFLILGDVCTRACRFCAVKTGLPPEYDLDEPRRVADAIRQMGLRYAVITSVDRDDLDDGGAFIFAETIRRTREACPGIRIEVLIPDFQGSVDALRTVVEARPDVLGHNIETVPDCTPRRARVHGIAGLWITCRTRSRSEFR